eukprot:TRINITY_DN5990_c0_g1_i2.p1 TRINITY_DN5990_c0_g1~~TRINITY_DN5990_c0_g1_i2.p1  ORF type:complete len:175 (-),score=36.75 TRINITY_DN5990_c0_g1_i2:144-668(-)
MAALPVLLGKAEVQATDAQHVEHSTVFKMQCRQFHQRCSTGLRLKKSHVLRSLQLEVPKLYYNKDFNEGFAGNKSLRVTVRQAPFGIDIGPMEGRKNIFVLKVEEGSAAEKMGVCAGDTVCLAGGRALISAADLQTIRSLSPPYDLVFMKQDPNTRFPSDERCDQWSPHAECQA